MRTINNSTVASEYSSERKNFLALTLNQKWEVVKRSEKGMLKAEIGNQS